MLSQKSFPNIDCYTDRQRESVFRIREMVQKDEDRLGKHYTVSRSKSRQMCDNVIQVSILSEAKVLFTFTAHMLNISSTGLSFLSPCEIDSKEIHVGLSLHENETAWFDATIVRIRKPPGEKLWEHGVKLNGRLN
ncbi:MAG: PilZ domain-containing protein [Planctomycetaceae bacterium]|nr:PilZ domain-containing protein [Planctomycetaceae bacterium]